MPKPPFQIIFKSPIQIGGIYIISSRGKALEQGIKSSLKDGAWEHDMVLVLGALSGRTGAWRILMVSSKDYDSHTRSAIPFDTSRNVGNGLRLLGGVQLPQKYLVRAKFYVRTEEEY